jgi:hypothetical protein
LLLSFYQKYIFIVILFSNLYNTKIWQEYSYTSIVQYSYIFLYDSYMSIVVAKFKWSLVTINSKKTRGSPEPVSLTWLCLVKSIFLEKLFD